MINLFILFKHQIHCRCKVQTISDSVNVRTDNIYVCDSVSLSIPECSDSWGRLLRNITRGQELLIAASGIRTLNTMLHAGVTTLQRRPLSAQTLTDTHTYTHWPREIAELHFFPFLFGPQPSVKGFWGNSDDDGVSRQRWQQFRTVQFSMSQEADTQMCTHTHQRGIYAWKDILDAHTDTLKGAANWAVSVKFYKAKKCHQHLILSF